MRSKASYDFTSRVAAITGGSSGIGLDIASRLLQAGAKVGIWNIGPPPVSVRARALCCSVDASDYHTLQQACHQFVSALSGLDLLTNSAGSTLPLVGYDPVEWQKIIQINLIGVYNACKVSMPQLRQRASGRIVNIASLAGKEGTPNASAYGVSRAAVLALTKSLDKELAQTSVLVNAKEQ